MLLLKPFFLLNKHYSNDCYGKRYLKHILTKTSLTAPLRLMISSGVSRYSPLCNHRLFCLRAIVFSFSHVALGVCEVKHRHGPNCAVGFTDDHGRPSGLACRKVLGSSADCHKHKEKNKTNNITNNSLIVFLIV